MMSIHKHHFIIVVFFSLASLACNLSWQQAPEDNPVPLEGDDSPTMETYRAWLQENHTIDFPGHGCADQAGILQSVSELGGGVIPLDENYFYITWFPENWEAIAASDKRLIITLHGNGGCAEKNFNWWLRPAQEHGYASVALQYAQVGSSPDELDFLDAQQVYENIEIILEDLGSHAPLEDALIRHGSFRTIKREKTG